MHNLGGVLLVSLPGERLQLLVFLAATAHVLGLEMWATTSGFHLDFLEEGVYVYKCYIFILKSKYITQLH